GSDEINRGMQQLDEVVQRSVASAEELASSALELSALVNDQREAISFFKLEEHGTEQTNRNIDRRDNSSPGGVLRSAGNISNGFNSTINRGAL
ncbi:MAG: hypothetical protein ACNYZG_13280, partial [Gammaproteobacteria bacterium]